MMLWEYSLGKEPSLGNNEVLVELLDVRRLSIVLYKRPSLYLFIMKFHNYGLIVKEIGFQVNVLWLEICGSFKLPKGKLNDNYNHKTK